MVLHFAMVCASNFNRSLAAHAAAVEAGLTASSYGVGSAVRLPGASRNDPAVFEFGTPYDEIEADLAARDTVGERWEGGGGGGGGGGAAEGGARRGVRGES